MEAWRTKDPRASIPSADLQELYASVQKQPLVQALDYQAEREFGLQVILKPARLPSKITYQVWSEPIQIAIPTSDREFGIQLIGDGLEFDPPLLDFSRKADATFRVRGTALGTKSLLFNRLGKHA